MKCLYIQCLCSAYAVPMQCLYSAYVHDIASLVLAVCLLFMLYSNSVPMVMLMLPGWM